MNYSKSQRKKGGRGGDRYNLCWHEASRWVIFKICSKWFVHLVKLSLTCNGHYLSCGFKHLLATSSPSREYGHSVWKAVSYRIADQATDSCHSFSISPLLSLPPSYSTASCLNFRAGLVGVNCERPCGKKYSPDVSLSFERHRLELYRSIYMQICFNNYIVCSLYLQVLHIEIQPTIQPTAEQRSYFWIWHRGESWKQCPTDTKVEQ